MLGIGEHDGHDALLSVHWVNRLNNDDLIVECASELAETLARTLETLGFRPQRIDIALRHLATGVAFDARGQVPSISEQDFANLASIAFKIVAQRYGLLATSRLVTHLLPLPAERRTSVAPSTTSGSVYGLAARPSWSAVRNWPIGRIMVGVVLGLTLGVLGLPRIELSLPAGRSQVLPAPVFPPPVSFATPVPVAPPAGRRVVFDQPLSTPIPGWPNNPGGTAWFGGGVYRLFGRQPGRFVATGVPLPESVGDAIVSARFHKVGGPSGGGYGLLVRAEGPPSDRDGVSQSGSYLVVEVGDEGNVGIWHHAGTRWIDVVPWTHSEAVQARNESNTLALTLRGANLHVEVNGQSVADVAYSGLPPAGGLGIFAGGDLNDVALEWLRVETVA